MSYDKYLILDLETTGLDPINDKIIKLTTTSFNDESFSSSEIKSRYFNPNISISEESEKIHGITNKFLNEHKQFKNYAKAISQYLENSFIIGYGIYDFHLPILLNEFLRSKVEFDIRKIKVIDMKKIYEKLRPRTLTNALRDFCSIEIENFDRKSDEKSEALLELFITQNDEMSKKNITLDKFLGSQNILDNDGFFSLNEKDEIIFSKGKHKDLSLQNVRNQFPDYLDWLMDNENISPMVKIIISYDQK